jgi:hypothetical protein
LVHRRIYRGSPKLPIKGRYAKSRIAEVSIKGRYAKSRVAEVSIKGRY